MKLKSLICGWLLLLIIAVILAPTALSTGESPSASWSKTYSQFNPDGQAYVNSIIQTSDGGYAAIADIWQAKTSNYGCLLLKLDAHGSVEWSQSFTEKAGLASLTIVQTDDGGYVVAGFTLRGTERFFWIVKTNAQGNTQWTKLYGDTLGVSEARALIRTSDGGYALAGDYGSQNTNGWAALLLKIDANGNQQWNKTYDTSQNDERFFSIIETADGGFAMAGQTGGIGNIPIYLLIKTDSTGDMLWNKTYRNTATSWDTASSVIQTSDGGYAIAGYTTEHPNNGNDGSFWLVKTDAQGKLQWDNSFGQLSWGANKIIQTKDGGYALSGCIEPDSESKVLIKTDPSGHQQWSYSEANRNAFTVIQTKDGGYALAGETRDDPSTLWVAKIAADDTDKSTLAPTASLTDFPSPPNQTTTAPPSNSIESTGVLARITVSAPVASSLMPWLPYLAIAAVAVVLLTFAYLVGVHKIKLR